MHRNRVCLKSILSLCLIAGFTTSLVEARFAVHADAASEVLFYNRTIEVKENGAFDETIEMKVKILNDSGKTNLATDPLYYDGPTEKIEIEKAIAIDQGEEHSVGKDFIEDKPIASQTNGFSSYHQVLISFPRLHVGTELYLKYHLKKVEPDLSEQYFTNFVYGSGGYWNSSQVKLVSAIPFHFGVNDPEGVLGIQSKKEGKKQILEISLKKPVFKKALNEQDELLNNRVFPWVSVSSVKDWKTLGEKITPEYERVLSQPLPQLYQEISAKAQGEAQVFDKINRVTSLLAQEVHYMGDWRSISGKLYPNPLEKVAQSRRGDCKDFSAATVAILRKLGIQASSAFVRRGGFYDEPTDIPSVYAFNHAIVRVESGNEVYWVDPTNYVSFAHGLFPDIADRWALPLKAGLQGREKIPPLRPEVNEVILNEEISLAQAGQNRVRGSLLEKGASAIGATGASLFASNSNIDYFLLSYIDDVNQLSHWKFKPYELTSRVVSDVKFEFDYEKRSSGVKTSGGPAYLIPTPGVLPRYFTRTQNRVSDLQVVDFPSKVTRNYLLNQVKLIGKSKLNCEIESRWLKATRKVTQKKSDIEVSDQYVFKMSLIPQSELVSPEFSQFQKNLEECFNQVAVIYQPIQKKSTLPKTRPPS